MADGQAEAAWEAHYRRIYPEAVFTPEYMAGAYRPAFIAGKKAGFHCGWEEATEAAAESEADHLVLHFPSINRTGARAADRIYWLSCACEEFNYRGSWDEAAKAWSLHVEGAEADPDVADTAWAIIDHHRHG